MAKVKFGMIVTDMRNKLGGHVFSKNRGGSYARTKVVPSNPQTVAQQAVRSALGAISSAWSGLTAPQRASFVAAVDEWKSTDVFGDLKSPSGKNLFTRLNLNLVNTGQAQVSTAPDKVDVPYSEFTEALIDVSDATVTFDALAVPAGFVAQVSATPPLSQGTRYVRNRFRVIGLQAAGAYVPATLWAQYVAEFGAPVAGDNIVFRIKLVGSNGQNGVAEQVKAVVTA